MQACSFLIMEFTDGLRLWRSYGARVVLAEWGVCGAVLSSTGQVLRGWLPDDVMTEAANYTAQYFSYSDDRVSDIENLFADKSNAVREYSKAIARFAIHMMGHNTDSIPELRDNTPPLKYKLDSRIMKMEDTHAGL